MVKVTRRALLSVEGYQVLPGTENADVGGVHGADEEPGNSGGVVGEVPGSVGEVPGSGLAPCRGRGSWCCSLAPDGGPRNPDQADHQDRHRADADPAHRPAASRSQPRRAVIGTVPPPTSMPQPHRTSVRSVTQQAKPMGILRAAQHQVEQALAVLDRWMDDATKRAAT